MYFNVLIRHLDGEVNPRWVTDIAACVKGREMAEQLAAELVAQGHKATLKERKLTPAEQKRADVMASFGKAYIPADVVSPTKWASGRLL